MSLIQVSAKGKLVRLYLVAEKLVVLFSFLRSRLRLVHLFSFHFSSLFVTLLRPLSLVSIKLLESQKSQ